VTAIHVGVALLPVVAFLAALWLMDSFRLVRPAAILTAIAYGALAAIACLGINTLLIDTGHLAAGTVSRFVAPIVEETAKALLLVVLIAMGRVGFLVDAAVQGFAVGTGFALIENLDYLRSIQDAPLALWIVRGLGTAVMHGATTSIFAMISKTLADRHDRPLAITIAPGWALAVAIHVLYNQRLLPAVAQTLVLLVVLPLIVLWTYARSERATREWIGAGLDLDLELLNLVGSEHFALTKFGRYLYELRARLPGPIIADMFCLLRLELELSVQAKALLLARDAGLEVPPDADLDAALTERQALRRSIGPTGLLTLKPLQVTTRRDAWHRHLLRRS